MTKQLDALEGKVAQVVNLCLSLRAENQDLRTRLAGAEEERAHLLQRMEEARSRLEALAGQLPEEGKA